MSTIPDIAIQPTLNELPPDRDGHYGRSSQIAGLKRQIRDLCTGRELNHRNIIILEDLNRTLGNTIGKLTTALDQQPSIAPAGRGMEFGISTLVWNLQRSKKDCAYLTDITIGQHQTIEGQSQQITMLIQQVNYLQRATGQSGHGHNLWDAHGVQAMERLTVNDDPHMSGIHRTKGPVRD